MNRNVVLATMAFALVAVGTLVLIGGPSSSMAAHASPPQVGLTASYSVIGGGGSSAQDLLNYTSNGVQQVVPLTGSPTVYMVDSGTQWGVQTVLNGSSFSERWITTTTDVSGTISAPLTVAFSYFHQYLVTFNFNVKNGGGGFSGPSVSFNALGSPASSLAPGRAWVDASSPYAFVLTLPGSSSSERWVSQSVASGSISAPTSLSVTYYHQFLVSSSYSIVGGGSPAAPTLSGSAFGAPIQTIMTPSTQGAWLDSGSSYAFSGSLIGSSTQRWMGTMSGNILPAVYNATVTSAISIAPSYYHQFLVNVGFTFADGSPTGLTPPAFTYQSFGSTASLSANAVVWADSGTQYTIPGALCCTSSPDTERWVLYNTTQGTISSTTTISPSYFHQYEDYFSYSIVGQPPPSPSGQPDLTYAAGGNLQHLTLAVAPQSFWGDAGSTYSATVTLSGSTASQRWSSQLVTGTIVGPAPNNSVNIAYTQQYLLTIVGGGLPTQWVIAGSNTSLSTPGVFGRSAGAGYRVVSYQLDGGSIVTVPQPQAVLSIPLSMMGPHTIAFQSTRQFQVSLDAGAAGGLASISPPTVPGDNYWYDGGSQVQVTLNGAWGRANGVGYRISSISATAQQTFQVDTLGTVQAYSTTFLESPVSITTTSATQYEVVLNQAAISAFASISPRSTFPNDTFWYDSGSPAVTVVLNGDYSRSAGTGFRTSSWEIDSGPVTKVATSGTFQIATKAMTSPHFLNATRVVQYQVTIDKGGASALSSMTSPSIPLDSGWYDASGPVGVVMNGEWGRAQGTGQRLAGYSINGVTELKVTSSGLVVVLNSTSLSSPEAIATDVVTQYQLTLDSGAASAIFSITSAPIAQDKYWYDSGTSVNVFLNGFLGRGSTSGSRLASFSVNQGAPTSVLSSVPVQVLSLSGISGPESITTKSVVQYRLSSSPAAWASLTNSTLPGDAPGWFDTGTSVKAVYNNVWNDTSAGSRESVASYAVDGGAQTKVARSGSGTFTVTLSMTQAHKIALTSVTQYIVAVLGSTKATASPLSQTADSYFDAGSKVAFTLPRVWNSSSTAGVREILLSYSVDGSPSANVSSSKSSADYTTSPITFSQPHVLVFNAVTQYEVAFEFFDSLGKNSVAPSLVELGVGNATVDLQGQAVWLANGTSFRVVNVEWQGSQVGPTPAPSYVVKAAPLNVTLDTRVYAASVKVVDLFGLPVSGARVSMTLANGTVVAGTTKADGTFSVAMVPLGAFTAKISGLGAGAQVSGNAASGQSVALGRVAFSLVSLLGIVGAAAAAGVGGFFVVRKMRRGKGSKPASGQK